MLSLNVKKKISVKALLFGCIFLCPALISVHSVSATYDSGYPLFSTTYDPEILDRSYVKYYSKRTDKHLSINPGLNVCKLRVKEVFQKDPFDEFWDMKTETSRNTEDDIAEKVEEQTSQYNGDYPGYKEECEDIVSQYYKDKESTISRHTSDFTPSSTKEVMEQYRQSIDQLTTELNGLEQICQDNLNKLNARAYEHDFHNYDGVYNSLCKYFNKD